MIHQLVFLLLLIVSTLGSQAIDSTTLVKPAMGYLQPQNILLGHTPLIVGGNESLPHAHPHQISLQLYYDGGWYHICGGSVITNDVILTAAHCIFGINLPMRVVAGDHNLFLAEGTEQISTPSKATHHPLYNSVTFDYDYAVIRLSTKLILNKNVQPIPLPDVMTEPSGLCMTTGWGNTRGDGGKEFPQKLQQIQMPIVDRPTCTKNYEALNPVTERMVCAGLPFKGVCSGDSGGPLICTVEGSKPVKKYLAGIVSWGVVPCSQENLPGVFAHPAAQLDWIHAQFENEETSTAVTMRTTTDDGRDRSMGTIINSGTHFALYFFILMVAKFYIF